MGLDSFLHNSSQVFKTKQCLGKHHAVFQGFILRDWVIGLWEYLIFEINQNWHITASQTSLFKIYTVWRSLWHLISTWTTQKVPQLKKRHEKFRLHIIWGWCYSGKGGNSGDQAFVQTVSPTEVFYFFQWLCSDCGVQSPTSWVSMSLFLTASCICIKEPFIQLKFGSLHLST